MSEKIVLRKINEVSYYVEEIDREQVLELKEYFSCYAANHLYHPLYKRGVWNGKIFFYEYKNRTFPIGLKDLFLQFCIDRRYQSEIIDDYEKNEITEETFKTLFADVFTGEYKPRDYQEEAIKIALRDKRTVLRMATSAGKSLVASGIIYSLLALQEVKNILLIVPNVSLVEQMFGDIEQYGFNTSGVVEKLYAGKKIGDCPVLISTWQSLMKKDEEFFARFECVIVDETQQAASVEIQKILKKCSRAHYRIGMTGTMPKERDLFLSITGMLGNIGYDLGASTLIEAGTISDLSIVATIFDYDDEFRKFNEGIDYKTECKVLETLDQRNIAIGKLVSRIDKNFGEENNILILVNRIEHLDLMKEYLEFKFGDKYKVHKISGSVKVADRETIRTGVEDDCNQILVCTYATVAAGVSMKRLHHVIFGSSSKSEIRVLQSIGRGLRKHDSKSKVHIWDIIDDLRKRNKKGLYNKTLNYGIKHFLERKQFYIQQNFPIIEYKIPIFVDKKSYTGIKLIKQNDED